MMIRRKSLLKLGVMPLLFLFVNYASGYEYAAELDRGHKLLLKKGFQIQAMVFPNNTGSFDLTKWAQSYFTTVNFGGGASPYYLGSDPGIPWARWAGAGYETDPLFSIEELYEPNMVSIQVGDEQVMSTYAIIDEMAAQLAYWKTNYPNLLVYNDMTIWSSWMTQDIQHMYYYLANAQPDMLVIQDYDFFGDAYSNCGPYPGGSFGPLYTDYQLFRILANGGHDASGDNPIPYGVFVQGFRETEDGYVMSESELRLNRFAAWAFGMKFMISWVYNTANETNISLSFTDNGTTNSTSEFSYIAETNRQGRNLGPTLLRLLCEDVRIVRGYHVDESTSTEVINPVPCYLAQVFDWPQTSPYYGNGSYITTVTAVNPGPKNPGVSNNYLPGDVLVSIFKPLCEEDDGPSYTDEQYFMILNGLSAPDGSCANTTQTITIDFDFGSSGITSLQRLNRNTGQVENVSLTPLGGSLCRLALTLEGGTADLFKYNTGAPFITGESGPWTYVTYQNTNAKSNVNNGDDEAGYGYTSNKPASGAWTWDYSLKAGIDSLNTFSANYIKFHNGDASAENQGSQGLKDSTLVMKISLSDYISSATWTPVRFYYNVDTNSSVKLKYSTDGANFTTCYTTTSGNGYSYPGTLNLTFAKPTKTIYIAYTGELEEGAYAYWYAEGGSMTFTAASREFDEWADILYENTTVKSQVNAGADTGGYAYSSVRPDSENWTASYSLVPSNGQVNIWSAMNADFKSGAVSPRQAGQIQDSSIIIKINTSHNINSFTWDPASAYHALENGSSITAKYSTDGENFTSCFTFPQGSGNYDQGSLTFSIPSTNTLYIGWFGDIGTGPYALYTLQNTGSLTFSADPLYWLGVSYNPNDGTVKSNVNNGTDIGGCGYDIERPEDGAWTETASLAPSAGNVSVQSAENITFTSAGIQAYNFGVNSSFVVKYNLDTPITSAVWTPGRIYHAVGTNGSIKLKYSTDGSHFNTVYTVPTEGSYDYPSPLTISVPAGTTTLYLGYFGYANTGDAAIFSTESLGTVAFTADPELWLGISYNPDDGTVKSNVNNGTDIGGCGYDIERPEDGAWTETASLAPSAGNVSVQSAENITFTSAGIQAYNFGVNSSFVVKYNLDTPITSAVWTPGRIYHAVGTNGSIKLRYSTDGSHFNTIYTVPAEGNYDYPSPLTISIPAGTTTLFLGYFGYADTGDAAVFSAESLGTVAFTTDPELWLDVVYSPDDDTVESNINNGADAGGEGYYSEKPQSGAWTETTSLASSSGNVSIQSADNVTFTSAGMQAYNSGESSSFVVRYDLSESITSAIWTPGRIYQAITNNGSVKLRYSTDGSHFTTVYTVSNENPYDYPSPLTISIPAGTTTLFLGYFGYADTGDNSIFSTESIGTLTFTP